MTLSPNHAIDDPIDTAISNRRFQFANLPSASSRSQLAFCFGRPFHRTKYSRIGGTLCFLVTRSARIVSTSFSRKLSALCWYQFFRGLECRPFLPTDFPLPLRTLSPCGLATSASSPASLPPLGTSLGHDLEGVYHLYRTQACILHRLLLFLDKGTECFPLRTFPRQMRTIA